MGRAAVATDPGPPTDLMAAAPKANVEYQSVEFGNLRMLRMHNDDSWEAIAVDHVKSFRPGFTNYLAVEVVESPRTNKVVVTVRCWSPS
jgi:hypothetical protein